MGTQWYHKSGNGESGPFQFQELVELARTGRVGRDDQVRSTSHKDWQTAESILHEYLPTRRDETQNPWDATVKSALAAVRQRTQVRGDNLPDQNSHASLSAWRAGGSVLAWLSWPLRWLAGQFGWLEDVLQWLDDAWTSAVGSKWARVALQIGFAMLCAGVVAVLLRAWSAQATLSQFVLTKGNLKAGIHYLPIFGECSSGEYWLVYSQALALSAASAYFLAAWLLKRD